MLFRHSVIYVVIICVFHFLFNVLFLVFNLPFFSSEIKTPFSRLPLGFQLVLWANSSTDWNIFCFQALWYMCNGSLILINWINILNRINTAFFAKFLIGFLALVFIRSSFISPDERVAWLPFLSLGPCRESRNNLPLLSLLRLVWIWRYSDLLSVYAPGQTHTTE